VNEKLASGGKQTRLKGFQDQSISNGRILLDLIDAIKPGTINYELVKEDNGPEVGNKMGE
jgi:plastin-3